MNNNMPATTVVKGKLKQPQHRFRFTFFKEIVKRWPFYVMVLPGLLFILIFNYLPMFGVIIAFKDYNPVAGILASEWIGFKNFEFFFKSDLAWRVTFNTIFYNLVILGLVTSISIVFSILLQETGSKLRTGLYKSIMLMPFFLSWVVGEYIVYTLLNTDQGLVNRIRESLGLEAIQWYGEPSYWRFIMPLAYLLKQVGYTSVIYVAAITGISPEYYEAAEIDGASKWQKAWYVTIPLLMPVVIILTLLSLGKIFNGGLGDWSAFYTLPRESGILFSTTDVIDTYVFRALRTVNDIGMSSAVGLYQAVVGLILVLICNYLVKKYDPESAMF
ncbi:ABC transporter permease [Paenibacillus pseudetheri]|uniref:Multiple-sugar transport system permease YteP n=1 Tax=Paenibacillus pseudetheri TaxID=2897682 RepID=A0ABM9BF02_9BACL|nr:ABC transporter permease subunit [Paenibacillus pseudetheri]CAH1057398.1 putative multiple-sugar transport system permease YteP [Paenibacillus pseudetheri]